MSIYKCYLLVDPISPHFSPASLPGLHHGKPSTSSSIQQCLDIRAACVQCVTWCPVRHLAGGLLLTFCHVAGTLSEAGGGAAEKAVLRDGLALPPGMLKGRHPVLQQMAVCLAHLPHLSMGALPLLTATILPAPIQVPHSTDTKPATIHAAMQVQFP